MSSYNASFRSLSVRTRAGESNNEEDDISVYVILALALIFSPLQVSIGSNQVTARSDFVGVLQPGTDVKDVLASSEVVTWYGDADGQARVLWTSDGDLEVVNDEGQPMAALFKGPLTDEALNEVKEFLSSLGISTDVIAVGLPRAYANHVVTVCSLAVSNTRAFPNQVEADADQSCVNHATQRLREELRKETFWPFWQVEDQKDTGFVAEPLVETFVTAWCLFGAGQSSWKNWADGDAFNSHGTFYNGPSAATGWQGKPCTP